MGQATQTVTAY